MTWKRKTGVEDEIVLDFQFKAKRKFTKVTIFTSNAFDIGAQVILASCKDKFSLMKFDLKLQRL